MDTLNPGQDGCKIQFVISGTIRRRTYTAFNAIMREFEASKQRVLPIIIDSGGGSEPHAVMIAARILAQPHKFVTYVPVQAASAAVFIFLAAQRRVMEPWASLMFHDTSVSVADVGVPSLHEMMSCVDTREASVYAALATHVGMVPSAFARLISMGSHKDEYVTAAECQKFNLCTDLGTLVGKNVITSKGNRRLTVDVVIDSNVLAAALQGIPSGQSRQSSFGNRKYRSAGGGRTNVGRGRKVRRRNRSHKPEGVRVQKRLRTGRLASCSPRRQRSQWQVTSLQSH